MTRVQRAFGAIAGAAVLAWAIAGPPIAAEQLPRSYHITVDQVPPPTTSVPNPPKIVPQPAGARLTVPPGFRIELFAEGLTRPRWAVEAPNGDVFVTDPTLGSVLVLRDANRNHTIEAAERHEFATGLTQPFGMAFANGAFYVADTDAVLRFAYAPGQLRASGDAGPDRRAAPRPQGALDAQHPVHPRRRLLLRERRLFVRPRSRSRSAEGHGAPLQGRRQRQGGRRHRRPQRHRARPQPGERRAVGGRAGARRDRRRRGARLRHRTAARRLLRLALGVPRRARRAADRADGPTW